MLHDGGVVDEQVDRPELLLGVRDRPAYGVGVADVHRHREHRDAVRARQLLGDPADLPPVRLSTSSDIPCAARPVGELLAEPAAGAGDDPDPAEQPPGSRAGGHHGRLRERVTPRRYGETVGSAGSQNRQGVAAPSPDTPTRGPRHSVATGAAGSRRR